jgi:hypothetical protein
MTSAMELAKAIADAVLYEGYLIHPYRPSTSDNRPGWQWGVLMPPSFTLGGEHPDSRAELLVVPSPGAVLHLRLRFLQWQERVAEVADGGGFRAVPSVTVSGREHPSWDEAVEREVDVVLPVGELLGAGAELPFSVDGGEDVEMIGAGARLVRRRCALTGSVTLRTNFVPPGLMRLTVRVRNTSGWEQPYAQRNAALRYALLSAHTVLSVAGGEFLSLVDPPDWAAAATAECRNERTWPVLVRTPGPADTALCAPIILYDHPEIAAHSRECGTARRP